MFIYKRNEEMKDEVSSHLQIAMYSVEKTVFQQERTPLKCLKSKAPKPENRWTKSEGKERD